MHTYDKQINLDRSKSGYTSPLLVNNVNSRANNSPANSISTYGIWIFSERDEAWQSGGGEVENKCDRNKKKGAFEGKRSSIRSRYRVRLSTYYMQISHRSLSLFLSLSLCLWYPPLHRLHLQPPLPPSRFQWSRSVPIRPSPSKPELPLNYSCTRVNLDGN